MTSRPRPQARAVRVLLLLMLSLCWLIAGCAWGGGEARSAGLRTFLESQPMLTSVETVGQSTASFTYAIEQRGEADVNADVDVSTSDLTALSAALAEYLKQGKSFKEVHVSVSSGGDFVTLDGRPDDDKATIATVEALRAVPGVMAIGLTRSWEPNGLTSDLVLTSSVTFADAAQATAGLGAATAAFDARGSSAFWRVSAAPDAQVIYQCETLCVPVTPQLAPVFVTLAAHPDLHVTVKGTSVAVVAPDAPTAVAVQAQLAESGATSGTVTVSGGRLTLTGRTAPTATELAALFTLVGRPDVTDIRWSPGSFELTTPGLDPGIAAAATVPSEATVVLSIEQAGAGRRTVTAQSSSFASFAQGLQPVLDLSTLSRLTAGPTGYTLTLRTTTPDDVTAAFTALRRSGWEGPRQIDVTVISASDGDSRPAHVVFTSTSTGAASDPQPAAGQTRAQQAATALVKAWDASGP